jgi:hypothetical protein
LVWEDFVDKEVVVVAEDKAEDFVDKEVVDKGAEGVLKTEPSL